MIDYQYISEIMMRSKNKKSAMLYINPKIARSWVLNNQEDVFFAIASNRYPIFYQNVGIGNAETDAFADLHLNNGTPIVYDNGYPKGIIERSYTNTYQTVGYILGKKYNNAYIPLFGMGTALCAHRSSNTYGEYSSIYIKHSDENCGMDFPCLSYRYGKCLYNVKEPTIYKNSYSSYPFNIECISGRIECRYQIGYIFVHRDSRGKYEFVGNNNIDHAEEEGYTKDNFGYVSKEYFFDCKGSPRTIYIASDLYMAKDEEKQNIIDYYNASSLTDSITWINNKFFDENRSISISDEVFDITKKITASLKTDTPSVKTITVSDEFNDPDACEEWEGSDFSDEREISIDNPIYPIF